MMISLFLDLIIRTESLIEQDFCELGSKVDLDWYKSSSVVPLSITTLEMYVDRVNWDCISSSHLYEKDFSFIKKFGTKLSWNNINHFNLSEDDVQEVVISSRIVPMRIALMHKLLSISQLNENLNIILSFDAETLLRSYSPNVIESLNDNDNKLREVVLQHSDVFADKCNKSLYLPKKYTLALGYSLETNWDYLITYCDVDEEYLEKYAVNSMNIEGWNRLSRGRIKLSDSFVWKHFHRFDIDELMKWKQLSLEDMLQNNVDMNIICKYHKLSCTFIDDHADELDWYVVCEHQDLPEWLMRKHIEKLVWGQVSLYQDMSTEFVEEFEDRLNNIKLKCNPTLKRR